MRGGKGYRVPHHRLSRLWGLIATVLVLTIVWVVFSENMQSETVFVGLVFAGVCIAVTNLFLLKGDYRLSYRLSVRAMAAYLPALIVQIYLSGFDAIYRVITRRVKVGVVEIRTTLPDDYHRSLFSTAITLTPGTVTLDQSGQAMTIIWLNCETSDPDEAGALIKGPFERILMPRAVRR